ITSEWSAGFVVRLNTLPFGRVFSTVRSGLAARFVSAPFCFFTNPLELFFQASEIFVRKFFKIDKLISSAFQRSNHFIEFQMSRFAIAILCILNEKDH